MCLLTTERVKMATEPFTVYKLMYPCFENECFDSEGKKISFKFPCQSGGVNVGDTVKAKTTREPLTLEYRARIFYKIEGQGVHAYFTKEHAEASWLLKEINRLLVVTEWEVPAGAQYWEDTFSCDGSMAATEMKFIKVCEPQ